MKIVTLDIETAPMLASAWRMWDQSFGLNQVHEHTRMLCFAAKYVGNEKVQFYSEKTPGKEKMLEAAFRILDDADVVVHYNGNRFDIPHLNRELLLAGLGIPSPYKSVDLMRVVKKNFKFDSNKLAHVTEQLGLTGKMVNSGQDLWTAILYGSETDKRKAWREMKAYNVQDTVTTEELFHRLRPFIALPHLALYDPEVDPDSCPQCGSANREKRGPTHTALASYQQFRCKDCGRWYRSGKALARVDLRSTL